MPTNKNQPAPARPARLAQLNWPALPGWPALLPGQALHPARIMFSRLFISSWLLGKNFLVRSQLDSVRQVLLQWARSLQTGFPGFAEKCPKNVLGVISGGRRQNVKKMSKKCPGVQLGSSWASAKCQKNVKKMSPDIFGTFF